MLALGAIDHRKLRLRRGLAHVNMPPPVIGEIALCGIALFMQNGHGCFGVLQLPRGVSGLKSTVQCGGMSVEA
jgi:hypothetical protein